MRQTGAQTFGNFAAFDDDARTLLLIAQKRVVGYDEIAAFSYEETRGSMGRGGVARAFTSNLMGDPSEYVATAMRIRLTLRGQAEPLWLDFIITPAKSTTLMYRGLKAAADGILAKLALAAPDAGGEASYTDELRRLSGLCRDGVITPEEFEAKKKQLLGL